MVTGQLADTPTRGLPTRGLDISRTGQFADYKTRALVNSLTGQVTDWTTCGLADAAKRTKTKHAKSPVASASCPVRDLSSPRVDQSTRCPVRELSSPRVGISVRCTGIFAECGLQNAESCQGVICGKSSAERSANYPLLLFCIPQRKNSAFLRIAKLQFARVVQQMCNRCIPASGIPRSFPSVGLFFVVRLQRTG